MSSESGSESTHNIMPPTSQNKPTLILIDGSNLAFRMYFALERTNMMAPDGRPSWAIFGFFKALLEVLTKYKPAAVVTAFDSKGPTFRKAKFDYYKANRPPEMPEQLSAQWPEIQRGINLFGLPIIKESGLEADDLIGTLSKQALEEGWQTFILSGDRDTFQLVNDTTRVLYPMPTGLEEYDAPKVTTKMGVPPHKVVDLKALAGDSSDNIPGVAGIGDKTAAKLLTEFEDLDEIYTHLDKITPLGVQKKLTEGRQSAYDSRFLAQIKMDCEMAEKFDFTKTKIQLDAQGVHDFFQEYKLHSLQKQLPKVLKILNLEAVDFVTSSLFDVQDGQKNLQTKIDQTGSWTQLQNEKKEVKYITHSQNSPEEISTEPQFKAMLEAMKSSQNISCGVKPGVLDSKWNPSAIESWTWSWLSSDSQGKLFIESRVCTLSQSLFGDEQGELDNQKIAREFNTFLKLYSGQVYGYNVKHIVKSTNYLNLSWPDSTLDIELGAYLENSAQKIDLQNLLESKWNVSLSATLSSALQRAEETAWTLELGLYYDQQLPLTLHTLWKTVESPLAFTIARMELGGLYIDQPQLKTISDELTKGIEQNKNDILKKLQEPELNLNSTQQLSQALAKHGFILKKATGGGKVSTDRDTLDLLAAEDETGLIDQIIEYRTLSKLRSTYTENLLEQISPVDHRLHGEFNQAQTATGRLSSRNPNLQNIPIRNETYGKLIRSCFAAEQGNLLVGADYSQIELRILAHFTQDPLLLETFHNNQDVHRRTASEIFEVPLEEVTSSQRRLGKTLNFALVYQQGSFATARMLGMSTKEAGQYIEKYFAKFAKVRPFIEQVLDQARQNGYVETVWGRRRYFLNLKSDRAMMRKIDERAAFNAVLQGSNADLIKMAMLKIEEDFLKETIPGKIILQVHDELILEVPEKDAEKTRVLLIAAMQMNQPLNVPIEVEAGIGKNWATCKI